MPNIQFLSRNVHIYKVLFQNNSKQDLGRKCSAWKDFGLGLEILLHSSLRDRGEVGFEAKGQLLSLREA